VNKRNSKKPINTELNELNKQDAIKQLIDDEDKSPSNLNFVIDHNSDGFQNYQRKKIKQADGPMELRNSQLKSNVNIPGLKVSS